MVNPKTPLEKLIPKGWIRVQIQDILEICYGKALKKADRDETDQVPVYGSSGRVGYHKEALTDGPCVVIGRKGTVRAVYLSNVSCWPIDTTYFIQPPDGISLKYVYYVLQFLNLRSLDKSTAIPGLNRNELYAQYIPIPPEKEQIRIVEEIEKQFTRLDVAISNLKNIQRKLQRARAAILKAATEGKLVPQNPNDESADILLQRILDERRRKWEKEQWAKEIEKAKQKAAKVDRKNAGNPLKSGEKLIDEEWQDLPESVYRDYLPQNDSWKQKYKEPVAPDVKELPIIPQKWKWASLDQIAYRITDGTHQPPNFTETGIPFIFVTHIVGGAIKFEKTRYISEETYQRLHKRCPVELGDILYSAVGSYGVAVPVWIKQRFSFQRHIAHIKPVDTKITNYLIICLNSPLGKEQAHRVARGVAQKTVTLGDLARFIIPFAPIEEQHRIFEEVERNLSVFEEHEKIVNFNLVRAQRLRRSILTKAFTGQLVSQNPDDESASILLKRIREEREKQLQEEIVKKQSKHKRGSKVKTKPSRRSLYEVLIKAKEPMNVYDLFVQSGFKAVFDQAEFELKVEVIDEFYEELRKEFPKRIEQIRPNKADVFLKAIVNET